MFEKKNFIGFTFLRVGGGPDQKCNIVKKNTRSNTI